MTSTRVLLALPVLLVLLAGCRTTFDDPSPLGGDDDDLVGVDDDDTTAGDDDDTPLDPLGDEDGDGLTNEQEGDGDSDGDGVPDAFDTDSDDDGILDATEGLDDPDGDGVPNYLDDDSDGDGVADLHEGSDDPDGDGVPSYLDSDSDDDGLPDGAEVGPDPNAPLDSDGDGYFDFEDADSDNDGLDDGDEPNIGTDPFDRDSDGDGYTDAAELLVGSDPLDSASGVTGYYAELAPRTTSSLSVPFTPEIIQADVLFVLDSTCSMSEELETMANNFSSVVSTIPIPDLAFGVAEFQDYPVEPFGYWWFNDKPFWLDQQITTNTTLVQGALDALTPIDNDGGDLPEASLEALYQALTGNGWDLDGDAFLDGYYDVPPFISRPTDAFGGAVAGTNQAGTPGTGNLGGAGFRPGSVPILVYTTDNLMRDADQPGIFDLPVAGSPNAGLSDVVAAAGGMGARFIGIGTDPTPQAQMQALALQSGSVADLDGNGSPDPLVFTGIDTAVVSFVIEGVEALTDSGQFDVSLSVQDPNGFVTNISPAVFPAVTVGTTVTFDVSLYPAVPISDSDQVFVFPMQVIGDGVGVLAEWELVIVVLADASG